MATDRTAHDTAADGTVMVSYAAGNSGACDVEVQQSSILHQALLELYNSAVLAADNDDVSGWAATTISFRMLTDGSTHSLAGVSFQKIPDKPYEAHGQRIIWSLMAADVVNT
jgi:hypothetical protein